MINIHFVHVIQPCDVIVVTVGICDAEISLEITKKLTTYTEPSEKICKINFSSQNFSMESKFFNTKNKKISLRFFFTFSSYLNRIFFIWIYENSRDFYARVFFASFRKITLHSILK